MTEPTTSDIKAPEFSALFLDGIRLIDTRSPIEFERGSFPNTVNLPLMTNEEREQIGLCYKKAGEQAAVALGHELVTGTLREVRIANWLLEISQHPEAVLYCFRGGLRSRTVQTWLASQGCHRPIIEGGYKALRSYLLSTLTRCLAESDVIVLAGRTGTAKTALLHHSVDATPLPAIDLEGLAHHRGSAFGKRVDPQPSQIDFENRIAIALLRLQSNACSRIIMEDESRLIGRCALPLELQAKLRDAPVVVVEASLEERVQHSWENYILSNYDELLAKSGCSVEAFEMFSSSLRNSLSNIQKRLGGVRFRELSNMLDAALKAHRQGDPTLHKLWIETLLRDYYDPMYDYQLTAKRRRIVHQGDFKSAFNALVDMTKDVV